MPASLSHNENPKNTLDLRLALPDFSIHRLIRAPGFVDRLLKSMPRPVGQRNATGLVNQHATHDGHHWHPGKLPVKTLIILAAALQFAGLLAMLISIHNAPEGEETEDGFKYTNHK